MPIFSVILDGRRTSMRLHPLERAALKRICEIEGLTPAQFVQSAVDAHGRRNCSASLRMALLSYLILRTDEFRDLLGPLLAQG